MSEKVPKIAYLWLASFMAITSYLMFDIPYFLHDSFGYGFCDTGGPCTRLFGNVPWVMPYLGLSAMFGWWYAAFRLALFYRKHPEALEKK